VVGHYVPRTAAVTQKNSPPPIARGTPMRGAASGKQHRLQMRVHHILLARGHDLAVHHASPARSKRPSATWCRRCGLKFKQHVGLPALLRLPDCLGTLSVDPIHPASAAANTATAASGSGVRADAAAVAGAANEPSDAQDELPGHLQIATRLVAPPPPAWRLRPTKRRADGPLTVGSVVLRGSRCFWAYRAVAWCSTRWSYCELDATSSQQKLRRPCALAGSARCEQLVMGFCRDTPPPGGWPKQVLEQLDGFD
jgi:hypothetical protein